jgi:hypothetical protein
MVSRLVPWITFSHSARWPICLNSLFVVQDVRKEAFFSRDKSLTIGSAPATRYLKMKVAIISDRGDVPAVHDAEPVLIDAFTNYLRSVELSDFENPGFYSHMRDQLDRRSHLVLGNGVSDGVLITEFLLR